MSTKQPVYIRTAFDKESRPINRYAAMRILQMNRRTAKRIKGGWKFIHGFEPAVITKSPCLYEINF